MLIAHILKGKCTFLDYYLKEQKHTVNNRDKSGATPLFYATLFSRKNTAALLLENGADVSLPDNGIIFFLLVACFIIIFRC